MSSLKLEPYQLDYVGSATNVDPHFYELFMIEKKEREKDEKSNYY